MKYNIIEQESFQIVGMKREISCANGENLKLIPKLWDEVESDGTCDLLLQLNNGPIKGILGVCAFTKESHANQVMDYWIAVTREGDIPNDLLKLEIPASKWVVFEVIGPMPDAMQNMWGKIYQEWFPTCGYEHAGLPELEVYTEEDPTSQNLYSEIWIPIK